MSKYRVFWLVFFGGLLLFAGAMVWYTRQALKPYPAHAAALQALQSDAKVQVRATPFGWVFVPQGPIKGGLAFYPGGLVEPQAYAPVLRRIAQGGYRVALLQVRFNLAVTEQGKARQAIAEAPDLPWAVGGHSLGGVVASNFADSNQSVRALVMWAAYPQNDLSGKTLPTLALFAEKDGVIRQEQLEASQPKFPKNTERQTIPGLNHAGFGAYGPQRGDSPATIAPEAGWEEIARRTRAFLDQALSQP
ncbi:MAG: alpha/beta hydrolase [Meiothermus sp.]|uniref:alpha/beta hydrolase n=1 Tax=Meiothermus sp. TaxID=1955249 RepID=UPI00298EEAFF|nr:alpha/beta hydrolase [Meiothermus sp.]MCX7601098.1 alpha/beta hydrolase [Meiothermus sp.]MDW8425317.1 alpha/beta hydrolase [Meiothermus sp.]